MAFPDTGAAVLVIGGGPAGLATASALARMGFSVSVVERSDYHDIRIGEHITPATLQALRTMGFPAPDGEAGHLCSSGVDAWWGSSTASHTDYFLHPAGRGFNLSRPLFDASLARTCREDGAAILAPARLVRADWKGSDWAVEVNRGGKAGVQRPRFIVDATGRSAAVARANGARVLAEDRQIAIVVAGNERRDPDRSGGRILIESIETGWWYFAPLSAGRCVCLFITDADLLPARAKALLPLWWREQLQRTSHVRRRLVQYGQLTDPIIRGARSQRLDCFSGNGWCAVGDAAMAFDPLSSRGIGKSIEQGHRVAHAIRAQLSGDLQALADYGHVLEEEHRDYRLTRASYYDIERRWPSAEFWQRRQAMHEDGTASGSGAFNPF